MKILMLSLDRGILDPASRVFGRMRAYADAVDELHIIVPVFSPNVKIPSFSVGNCTVYSAYSRYRLGYFISAYRLGLSVIRDCFFTLSCDRSTAQDAFPTGIIAWALWRRTGIPFELQAHVPFFDRRFIFGSVFQFVQYVVSRILYPRANGVRVVSRAIASYMAHRLHIPLGRISTIPVFSDFPISGLPPSHGVYRDAYSRFRFIVCVPARFVPEKNIAMAIRAATLLSPDYPDIGWIIMGSGPEDSFLRRLARASRGTVVFEPWSLDPSELYRSADLYVCTSWYEGWGLGIIEAMRSGVPVITTPVGCVPELMRDSESCLIVPCGDSAALTAAVIFLYKNPGKRASITHAALRAARAAYVDSHSHAREVARGWSAMTAV